MKKAILCLLFSVVGFAMGESSDLATLHKQLKQFDKKEEFDEKEEEIKNCIAILEEKREKARHNVEFSGNAYAYDPFSKQLEKLYKNAHNDLAVILKELAKQNNMLKNVQEERKNLEQLIAMQS